MQEPQVSIEELGSTRRRLEIEVPVELVSAELEKAFGQVSRVAKIRGFRPGHVPRSLLEKYYGDQVRADVLSHLIEHSYGHALTRAGLRPAGPPEIVPQNVEAGKPLRYIATVDIWPELEIGDCEGLEAKRPIHSVSDEDVDRAVDNLRESLAELRPIADREDVRVGDFVTVDYEVSIEGKPAPEGKRENRLIEVGRGSVPEPLDQALAEMKVGETRPVSVDFPADHPDAQVAGKTVRFDVTVRGLREKIVPAADDDLAKEHGECDTLADLRERMRERMGEALREESDASVREQIVDAMLARNPFEAPKSLVDRQTESLVGDVLSRLGPQAAAVRSDPQQLEKMRVDLRPRAERQVRAAMALDRLSSQLEIEVTDEDVEARLREIATRAGQEVEKVRAAYGERGALDELRARISRERALDRLLAQARVEEVDAARDDVARSPEKG